MKVYDFTEPELAFYQEFANFDEQEQALFDLSKKKIPLEQCCEIMHCEMSTVKKISQRVNNKIIRLTNIKRMKEWIENVYWKKVLK